MAGTRRACGAARRGTFRWRGRPEIGLALATGILAIVVAVGGLPATAALADHVVVWLHFFQVNGDGAHRPRSIAANATGAYVSGEIADQNGATLQRMVQRYDPAGTMLWERDISDYPTSGSTDIAVTGDDVYVALNNLVPSAGGGQHEELYLRKYDASGNVIWTRDVGAEGNGAGPVTADAGGAFIVSTTRNDAGFETGNLIKHYDPAGNQLWTHPISFPFGTELAVGGGTLYYGGYDENSIYALHHLDASGAETWHGGSVSWGPVYGAGGAIIKQLGNAPDNATLVKYAADGSIVWSQIVASAGISGLELMAADDSHIYVVGSRSGDFAQMLLTLDANGAVVGVEDDGAWYQNAFQQFVAVDGNMYACCASWPGRFDEGLALAKLRTSQGLSGQVTWSDAYPERVGQTVAGATVTVGSSSVQTDSQGNYSLPAELAGQQATIELPLFDVTPASASSPGAAPRRAARLRRAAALSTPRRSAPSPPKSPRA